MRETFFGRSSLAVWAGFAAVAAARLLTLPKSLWEYDEMLFAEGVLRFDPLHHRPHPPGYPLLIGLGKLLNLAFHDPFASLVTLSVVASLVGYLALVAAFRRLASAPATAGTPGEADDRRAGTVAVVGALLFCLSPAMLVVGPLAMSDPPALCFLALALAAAARLADAPGWGAALATGAAASAAIGCRPQLAIIVLPFLAAVLFLDRNRRRAGVLLAAFTTVSLAWFLPLLAAVGGPAGLATFLGKQAQLVAQYDAGQARDPWSHGAIASRFLAHAWGVRWTSLPMLALAALGAAHLLRLRRTPWLPLALLATVHFAFCLAVMEPEDGVRYSLPGQIAVALAAAVALAFLAEKIAGRAAWAYLPAALLAGGFVAYAAPLLSVRARTLSPPVQAAQWITAHLPDKAALLVDEQLMAHVTHLLPRRVKARPYEGLERFAQRRFQPLYYLADGESRWPGAQTFRWPESDAYGKLTRNHYRVVSLSPIPAEKRYAALSGVSPYEPSLADPLFRWLAPEARLRLYPRGARAVVLTLALPTQVPFPGNRVTVRLDGRPVATLDVPRGSTLRAEIPLPDAPVAELSLLSAASFVPSVSGISPDRRTLAIELRDLILLDP